MQVDTEFAIMGLYPEQIRAIDFLRLKGTQAALPKLREKLAKAFLTLETLADDVPPAWRAVRPREGAWSVHEVIDHLVVTHALAAGELQELIAGRLPKGEPFAPGLVSEDPFAVSWGALLGQLREVHRNFLDAANAGTEDTALDVRTPIVLVVKVPGEDGKPTPIAWRHDFDWKAYVQAFRYHTLEHVEQIKRILAELAESN
ncbi:MAG: DinB family protein [Candidatus Hydrogenedentes bacterium]|nr:DinB family protein [Candidatus Hydrogenedentota bacterium]